MLLFTEKKHNLCGQVRQIAPGLWILVSDWLQINKKFYLCSSR